MKKHRCLISVVEMPFFTLAAQGGTMYLSATPERSDEEFTCVNSSHDLRQKIYLHLKAGGSVLFFPFPLLTERSWFRANPRHLLSGVGLRPFARLTFLVLWRRPLLSPGGS